MAVKTDFLISPAYSVPPISTRPLAKSTRIKTSELVPSMSGKAWKPGQSITTSSGLWTAISSGVAWMNMLCANRLCQAYCVMMRMGMR